MIELLVRTITMGTPLLYGSLSEVYAERSGVMNTAIEGIFLLGAWAGFVVTYQTNNNLVLGMIAAMAIGILAAALYGWICIYLKQNQIVTGTAISILALGFCSFFQRVIFGAPVTPLIVQPLPPIAIPVLSQIPVIGPIFFDQNILTYLLYIIVPVANFVLFNTALGLSIRSIGENPEAGDVAGIRVNRTRFLTILFAGLMCGVAGAFYSIGYLGLFTVTIIGGRGWIAFAICFLGNWKPYGALAGTLVFGLAEAIAISMQSSGTSLFPNELFIALPYILTIVLTVARRSFNVPAQLGVPYRKEG